MWRKREHTNKGPGCPAHNAQPQSCSGEPIPIEELAKKEQLRRERKLRKSLEKQQAKLAARGIRVGLEDLQKKKKLSFSIDSILDHIQIRHGRRKEKVD